MILPSRNVAENGRSPAIQSRDHYHPFQIAILLWIVAALLIVYRTEQLQAVVAGLFG